MRTPSYHDAKPVHLAAQIRPDGRVSAACSPQPRAICLRVASWTLCRQFVTCKRCRALEPAGRLNARTEAFLEGADLR
jgi:hypothetical protein